MIFHDRVQAGVQLAEALHEYENVPVVVFALPRGGVPVAIEVARVLKAPLDLVIARKIGHPVMPEYAIAAVSESGVVIANEKEASLADPEWFRQEKEKQQQEALRRREKYIGSRKRENVEGKIAIIVDDGVATGLTMRAAVEEIKKQLPEAIIIAVPVASREALVSLEKIATRVVALHVPDFFSAIAPFYESFEQVSDEEVITYLREYNSYDHLHTT